jgi:hypothetical protein
VRCRSGRLTFELISHEITDRARSVFQMSAQQEALSARARREDRTVDDVAPEDDG